MGKKIKNINPKNDAVAILILDKTNLEKLVLTEKIKQ